MRDLRTGNVCLEARAVQAAAALGAVALGVYAGMAYLCGVQEGNDLPGILRVTKMLNMDSGVAQEELGKLQRAGLIDSEMNLLPFPGNVEVKQPAVPQSLFEDIPEAPAVSAVPASGSTYFARRHSGSGKQKSSARVPIDSRVENFMIRYEATVGSQYPGLLQEVQALFAMSCKERTPTLNEAWNCFLVWHEGRTIQEREKFGCAVRTFMSGGRAAQKILAYREGSEKSGTTAAHVSKFDADDGVLARILGRTVVAQIEAFEPVDRFSTLDANR